MNRIDDYIRIKLELFEGPLDLLLHLIRSQQIDISAISIARITDQYLETIELMKELDLDVAGDFLVMAATLILIKSRMLLPPSENTADNLEEEDPREELIRRLKQYELFKEASLKLEDMEQIRHRMYSRPSTPDEIQGGKDWIIDVSLVDLLTALKDIIIRRKDVIAHIVRPSPVSVREKMTRILELIRENGTLLFSEVFDDASSRQDVIATFLAILELVRTQLIRARQRCLMSDIRLVLCKPRQE
ncbi:segregation/condensation protein A [bacterium]|nr:segregation/condensation protein A [candidate division CSSED10-310 bacterium]